MTFPLLQDGTLDLATLFTKNRALFGACRMEGEDPPAPPAPAPTPKEFRAPASQEDLDRIINSATAKVHGRYSDYEDLKAKAAKHDALELEMGSAADKAAAQARQDERDKANSEWTPRVVRAEFKSAAKGVLTDEALAAVLEDLDLSKYLTATGDVDDEKVAKKVAALAPAAGGNGNQQQQNRSLGQGHHQQAHAQAGDAGRAAAARRFPKTT